MIQFFREHNTARKTILWILIALFCIGLGLNNTKSQSSYVGNRLLNYSLINRQIEALSKQNPHIPATQIQSHVINEHIAQIKLATKLEQQGLKPSTSKAKALLKEQFQDKDSLLKHCKQTKTSVDNILTQVSDQQTLSEFQHILTSSAIHTTQDTRMNNHLFSQKRSAIHIDLSIISQEPGEDEYKSLYVAHKNSLVHPETYSLSKIDITPETLNLTPPSATELKLFFQKNKTDYAEQNIQFETITYTPSRTAKKLNIDLPDQIVGAVTQFNDEHHKTSMKHDNYSLNASSIPENRLIALNGMGPNKYKVIYEGESLVIIKHKKTIEVDSVAESKKDALLSDCTREKHQKEMLTATKQIAEYAYTHPESIQDLSKAFNLPIKTFNTSKIDESLNKLLRDPDVSTKRYISDLAETDSTHYYIIQVSDYTAPKTKTLKESLPELREIYNKTVLVPKVAYQLQQTKSYEEIDSICAQYGLRANQIVHENISDQLSAEVFQLKATLSNKNPSRFVYDINNPYWIQLQSISYNDKTINEETSGLSSFEHEHYLQTVL